MRGKPKDGYHRWHSNKHYKQTVELHKYNATTEENPPEAEYCCGRGSGEPVKR